jgi:hypothetical protein
MKHYKDPITNELYAYEADGSQDAFIKEGLVAITNTEADATRAAAQQAAFNALTYAEKRVSEYPSIGDQLDALFHAGVFPAEMAAAIQAVKDKYPKGA